MQTVSLVAASNTWVAVKVWILSLTLGMSESLEEIFSFPQGHNLSPECLGEKVDKKYFLTL